MSTSPRHRAMTSRMGRPVEDANFQTVDRLEPKHYIAPNYASPPNHELHQRTPSQDELLDGRDSLGSDCVPGMVEDHGSDLSTEDSDYQGTELWDSFWQSQVNCRTSRVSPYPALLSSPAASRKPAQGRDSEMCLKGQLHEVHVAKDQQSQSSMPLFGATAERHRSKTPKPRPRASYSIFPPASPPSPPRSSLARARTGSISPPTSQSSSSIDTQIPSTGSRGTISVDLTTSRPSTAMAKPTKPVVQATIRAVTPTPSPPFIPIRSIQAESPRPSSRHKPLPELPADARAASRRPSLGGLRKLSLSKLATNSSPSLARLAQTQVQQAALSTSKHSQHPLRESSLPDQSLRPLPPLPAQEREPTPPLVSVFDFDSDSESVKGYGYPRGGFARRLIHGLAHPLRKEKAIHQRSSSDGQRSATPPRTRSRAETIGAEHNPAVGVSRQGDGDDNSANKPWLTRQSSEVFGRILGRWSA